MKQLLLLPLLFITVLSFGQVPNYVPTNGLVGYWPFNGNANDESPVMEIMELITGLH